jgi:hypothetical protein
MQARVLNNATAATNLLGLIYPEIRVRGTTCLMVYLSWLELRTQELVRCFFPRPIPCEWAPLMGGDHPRELGQHAQG